MTSETPGHRTEWAVLSGDGQVYEVDGKAQDAAIREARLLRVDEPGARVVERRVCDWPATLLHEPDVAAAVEASHGPLVPLVRAPVCDCYPEGVPPEAQEGPQEWCPVHGQERTVLIQQRDAARALVDTLRAEVAGRLADAWDEGREAGWNHVENQHTNGIPHDPPTNPYEGR